MSTKPVASRRVSGRKPSERPRAEPPHAAEPRPVSFAYALNYLMPGDHVVIDDGPSAGVTLQVFMYDAMSPDRWRATMESFDVSEQCGEKIPLMYKIGALINSRFVIIAGDAEPPLDDGEKTSIYGFVTATNISAATGKRSREISPADHVAKMDLVCSLGYRRLGVVLMHMMFRMLAAFGYTEVALEAVNPKVASLYSAIGFRITNTSCRVGGPLTDARTFAEIEAFWGTDAAKAVVKPEMGIDMRLCGIDRVNAYEPLLARMEASLLAPTFDVKRDIKPARIAARETAARIERAIAERDVSQINDSNMPQQVVVGWVLDGTAQPSDLSKTTRIKLAVMAARLAHKSMPMYRSRANEDDFFIERVLPVLAKAAQQ